MGGRTGWLWSEMNESACSLGEFRDREISVSYTHLTLPTRRTV